MLLGDEHPFAEVLKEQIALYEEVTQTPNDKYKRKLYSMSNDIIKSVLGRTFIELTFWTRHSAKILPDNSLVWNDKVNDNHKNTNQFINTQGLEIRLSIYSNSHAPALFWNIVTSCKSLEKFLEIMEHPEIRRMILTYGMTILESSSYFYQPRVAR